MTLHLLDLPTSAFNDSASEAPEPARRLLPLRADHGLEEVEEGRSLPSLRMTSSRNTAWGSVGGASGPVCLQVPPLSRVYVCMCSRALKEERRRSMNQRMRARPHGLGRAGERARPEGGADGEWILVKDCRRGDHPCVRCVANAVTTALGPRGSYSVVNERSDDHPPDSLNVGARVRLHIRRKACVCVVCEYVCVCVCV